MHSEIGISQERNIYTTFSLNNSREKKFSFEIRGLPEHSALK